MDDGRLSGKRGKHFLLGALALLVAFSAFSAVTAQNTASDAKLKVPGNTHFYGNDLTAVGHLNPNGGTTMVGGDLNLTGDSELHTSGVYTDFVSSTVYPGKHLPFNSNNDVLVRPDFDADNGGPYNWRFSGTNGSLIADGTLDMQDNRIEANDANGQTSINPTYGAIEDREGIVLSAAPNINIQGGAVSFDNTALYNTAGLWRDGDGTITYDTGDSTNEHGINLKEGVSDENILITSNNYVRFRVDDDGSEHECLLNATSGNFECDGTKNWVHTVNDTHEAVYTSQEGPQVRAVVEDTTTVEGGRRRWRCPSTSQVLYRTRSRS